MRRRLGQNEISIIERVVRNLSQNQVHELFSAQGLKLNYMIMLSPSHLINSVRSVSKLDTGLYTCKTPIWLLPFCPHGLCVSP